MNSMPNEVTAHIFSYLTIRELLNVSLVCRNWNAVQKLEAQWRGRCLTYLESAEPFKGSWKKCFQTLHNWKTGQAIMLTYSSSGKVLGRRHDFTILEHNPLEIYPNFNDP